MLEGKTALVTGGSCGIGRGIALSLASAGADVALTFRQRKDLALGVASEIEAMGRNAFPVELDLERPESILPVIDGLIRSLGKIDVLVNNAGVAGVGGNVGDTATEEFDRLWRVNTLGHIRVTQSVLPHMRDQRSGVVIFISSDVTVRNVTGCGAYLVSKAALEAVSRILAREELARGVRVNTVAPGMTDTDWHDISPQAMRNLPFGRLLAPSEIGALCAFLASDAAAYISGEVICVNAGKR